MSRPLRRFSAAVVTLLVVGAVVALSRAPYRTGQGDGGLLRLSWSGRPQRIERCRELSDEELAKRPAHMRLRLECEGHAARYAVGVGRDGVPLSLDTVTGGGLRGDRSIHMLREYRLPTGTHAISVEIARIDSVAADTASDEEDEMDAPGPAPADRARREREERRRQREEMLPALLTLDTTMQIPEGGVVMVTYDPTRRRLVAITRGR